MDDNTRIPAQNLGKPIHISKPEAAKPPQASQAEIADTASVSKKPDIQTLPYIKQRKILGNALYAAIKEGKLPEGVSMQSEGDPGNTPCGDCGDRVPDQSFTFKQGKTEVSISRLDIHMLKNHGLSTYTQTAHDRKWIWDIHFTASLAKMFGVPWERHWA